MDPLSIIFERASALAHTVPYFYLIIVVLFIAIVVWGAVAYGDRAKRKAEENVAHIIHSYDVVASQLAEAERIGHFGSFVWDFVDASESNWTPEMYELLGFVPRKGVPALDAFVEAAHPEDKKKVEEEWIKAQKVPAAFEFNFRVVVPRSTQIRYLRIEGKNIRDGSGKIVRIQGVAHDVTKETEIDRAKTEFVSLASHQLKTPVTAIKWLSEILLNPGGDPLTANQRNYVENIHTEGQHMIDIVNDMLNVSRIELGTLASKMEEFDAFELLHDVMKEQQHVADQKKLNVRLDQEAGLPHMIADRFLVRMVFQNLLSNAIKYTPEGGTVECQLTRATTTKDSLFLRVSDTGIGIPKEARADVFKKLYRAQNAQNLVPDGTGLGLYVIKIIVERVHGGITFESTEGKGTTFYVSVPFLWDTNVNKHTV